MQSLSTRKLRLLLIAPLVVIPLLTLLAWAVGVGKKTPAPQAKVDTQVPAPTPEPVRAQNKMGFYELAARDSAKFAAALKADQAAPPARDTAEARVYKSLARLQAALNVPPKPLPPPEVTYPKPQPRVIPVTPLPVDTEMERYSKMLDKIYAIQHPEQQVRKPDTAKRVEPVDVAQAVTEGKGVLISGETIALRLETDLKVKGWKVPAGTRIYGTVSLENERLRIHIRSILSGEHIYPVNIEAYDLDGQPGIYVPGSLDRDASKASADEALGTLGITNLDPSLGAQAAGAGIQAVKTLLSHKVRQVRVTVREGYQLLLK